MNNKIPKCSQYIIYFNRAMMLLFIYRLCYNRVCYVIYSVCYVIYSVCDIFTL